MRRINNNEFKCSICGGIFEKKWIDKEAINELHNNFGKYKIADCDIVCDDCYKQMNNDYLFKIFNEEQNKTIFNEMCEKYNINKKINGFIINNYDSFCKYLEHSFEEQFKNTINQFADINKTSFGESYRFDNIVEEVIKGRKINTKLV